MPHDEDAERAVLAAILRENSLVWDVLQYLGAGSEPHGDFPEKQIRSFEKFWHVTLHRTIFAAMVVLCERGEPVDVLTLRAELRDTGKVDPDTGAAEVAAMCEEVHSKAENLAEYLRRMKETWRLRRFALVAMNLTKRAWRHEMSSAEVLKRAEALIAEVSDEPDKRTLVPVAEVFAEQLRKIEQGGEVSPILPTGIEAIDRQNGGIPGSGVTIIGARPSVGKTAFAVSIVNNIAWRQGKAVAVFSLEMNLDEIVGRIACSHSGVDLSNYLAGKIVTRDEGERLARAYNDFAEMRYFVRDKSVSVAQIRADCVRMKMKHGLDVIVVDYFTLIQSARREPRHDLELGRTLQDLKRLGEELNCPVILLSQLNRGIDEYTEPELRHLRETGAAEQDAQAVFFLWRDAGYDENPDSGVVHLKAAKYRNGKANWREQLAFTKFCCRFNTLSRIELADGGRQSVESFGDFPSADY